MSRIFDALHRVEEERRGATGSPRITATELLERAERQARGQRNAEGRVARLVETTLAGGDEQRLIGRSGEDSQQKPGQLETVLPDVQSLHLTLPLPNRLVALSDPSSPAAEAFRLVSIRLREMRRERPLKSILISSTSPQEGKSLIAANLACTLARVSGQTVLLLEGDVRRPSQEALFRVEPMPGLCEYFHGTRGLRDSIYRLEEAGIWLLPAGRAHDNSPEVIQAAPLSAMATRVCEWFDWVIIDSPPILPLADTSVWVRLAEGILLVARHGITQKRLLKRGLQALDPQKLIGAVMNSTTSTSDQDYYYYRRSSPPASSSDNGH